MSAIRRKFFITLAVFVITVSVFVEGFIYLFQNLIMPLAADYFITRGNIAVAEDQMRFSDKVVDVDLEKYKDDLERARKLYFTFTSDGIRTLQNLVRDLAPRNGVLAKIPSLPTKKPAVVSLQLTGTYPRIAEYIRELEAGPLLLTIDSMAITAQENNTSAIVQFTLQAL